MPDVLEIQRGRFVQWQPAPVICSAATSDGTVAAVGREDGTIELWDTLSWQLLKVNVTLLTGISGLNYI
jgi:WD40 repeat protein